MANARGATDVERVTYSCDIAFKKETLRHQLQRVIEASGMTVYKIAKESGVDKAQLSRFLSGKGGMTLDTIERLAPVLGIAITTTKTTRHAGKHK